MTTRCVLSALLLATSVGALVCPSPAAAAERPNIVFVLFDDMGWGQPPSYSPQSALRTPNLDRLAAQGMRFTDAHSASAVCTPTRYGVLTGRYPFRIGQFGVLQTWSPPIIPASRMTVASLLKQQGYATACVGKWHLGLDWSEGRKKSLEIGEKVAEGPNQLGFDYFCGFTHARGIESVIEQDQVIAKVDPVENQPLMMRKAVQWLEDRDSDRPFFLYFPVGIPHYPVVPAPEYVGKSGGVDEAGRSLKGKANPELYPDWLYQGDAMLGKIMDVLQRKGMADNTLLIATSDNGAEHRVYPPLRASKRSIYEGGHRVPFVARWPGQIEPGSTWDHTICLNDLLATAADITGAKVPASAGEDSVSMLPALLGKTNSPTREATVHQSIGRDLAIRQGPWKLIFHKNGRRELFHLRKEIRETSNVLDTHPEVASRLADLMQSYIENGRSTPGMAQENEHDVSLSGKKTSEQNRRQRNRRSNTR